MTPTEDITSVAYAVTLGERMDDAIARQAAAARMLIQLKQTISIARETLKAEEAEIVTNGGIGEIVLDGRNAEQRAAQLTAALTRHLPYTQTQDKLRAAEREAQECEADIDTTANEIKYCRLMIEFGTALNYRLAGEEPRVRNGGRS